MDCTKIISEKVESIPLKKWTEFENENKDVPEIREVLQLADECKSNLQDLVTSKIRIYDTKQLTIKLAGNGQYGASVAKGFRFYNPHVGEAITSQGVEIIQMVQELVDNLGYEVIYGDTDSMFIRLDEHIPDEVKEKGIDEVRKYIYDNIIPNIYDYINKKLDEHARNVGIPGNRKHYFEMKQEMIGRKMLLLEDRAGKGYAKKRYLIHIIDEENVKQDKIKAVGVEIRRSELPKFIKDRIWKFVEGFMKDKSTDNELLDYLIEVKKEIIDEIENKNVKNFGRLISVKNLDEYKNAESTQQSYGTYIWNEYVAPNFNVPYIQPGQKVQIVNIRPKQVIHTDNKVLHDIHNAIKNKDYFVFNPIVEIKKVKDLFQIFDIDKEATLEKMLYNQVEPYLKALGLSVDNIRYGISNVSLDDLI